MRTQDIHKVIQILEKEVQKAIYPVGFYKTKAQNIKKIYKT